MVVGIARDMRTKDAFAEVAGNANWPPYPVIAGRGDGSARIAVPGGPRWLVSLMGGQRSFGRAASRRPGCA